MREMLHRISVQWRVRPDGSHMQEKWGKFMGWVDDPDSYPVAAKRHTFEYLREVPHLRMRTNTIGAVTRVRIVHNPAPSIRAASSSSAGIFWKNDRSIQIVKGWLIATSTAITAQGWP